jgi:hypothetical protein
MDAQQTGMQGGNKTNKQTNKRFVYMSGLKPVNMKVKAIPVTGHEGP